MPRVIAMFVLLFILSVIAGAEEADDAALLESLERMDASIIERLDAVPQDEEEPVSEETASPTPSSTEVIVIELEPLDAVSVYRELIVAQMDPWEPLDSWGSLDDPRIPLQLRVSDANAPFDVIAAADDSLEPKLESEWIFSSGSGHFRCTIVMYHGFRDPPRTIYEVSSAAFEQQCRFLSDSGIEVIPLSLLVDALTTKQYSMVPDRSVVITVDDGYKNFYTVARPILKKYGFPATISLYTNFIGSGRGALNWDEVREMVDEGWVEIACHSRSHPNLAKSRGKSNYSSWLQREIVGSRNYIEYQTGFPVKTFTYPYGSYNNSTQAVVKNSNYEATLSCHAGPTTSNTDPFVLPRYGIYRSCGISKFSRFVQGYTTDAVYLGDSTEN